MIGYRAPDAGLFLPPEPDERVRVIWYSGVRWTVTKWSRNGASVTSIHRPNGQPYRPLIPLANTVDVFVNHGN